MESESTEIIFHGPEREVGHPVLAGPQKHVFLVSMATTGGAGMRTGGHAHHTHMHALECTVHRYAPCTDAAMNDSMNEVPVPVHAQAQQCM
jgi:hypothetical protein